MTLFGAAFSLGLLSSLHCLGMCGPLAMMMSAPSTPAGRQLPAALTYNFGRVTTYVVLGLALGLLGKILWINDFQRIMAIVLGVCLLLGGLSNGRLTARWKNWTFTTGIARSYRKIFHNMIERRSGPFVFGVFNGLLPCGMVYLALAGALLTEGALPAATFMFSFGLGTLPVMLVPFLWRTLLPKWLRRYLPFLQRAAVILTGLVLLARGIEIALPQALTLVEMLKHPVMCH